MLLQPTSCDSCQAMGAIAVGRFAVTRRRPSSATSPKSSSRPWPAVLRNWRSTSEAALEMSSGTMRKRRSASEPESGWRPPTARQQSADEAKDPLAAKSMPLAGRCPEGAALLVLASDVTPAKFRFRTTTAITSAATSENLRLGRLSPLPPQQKWQGNSSLSRLCRAEDGRSLEARMYLASSGDVNSSSWRHSWSRALPRFTHRYLLRRRHLDSKPGVPSNCSDLATLKAIVSSICGHAATSAPPAGSPAVCSSIPAGCTMPLS
mmetsp:Transcript_108284/g.241760  ORF Transcript_108284/g.241760 Transcript_108284/m.241760 type:complete len:264 (+) Transcript_108284:3-794(+)